MCLTFEIQFICTRIKVRRRSQVCSSCWWSSSDCVEDWVQPFEPVANFHLRLDFFLVFASLNFNGWHQRKTYLHQKQNIRWFAVFRRTKMFDIPNRQEQRKVRLYYPMLRKIRYSNTFEGSTMPPIDFSPVMLSLLYITSCCEGFGKFHWAMFLFLGILRNKIHQGESKAICSKCSPLQQV